MSYAIRNDGTGWRAVNGPEDVGLDEVYSDEPPPPITPKCPASVTMRQARLALNEAGKLAAVNAAVAAMPGVTGDEARIEWEFSSTVERHRPLVTSLASALALSEAQLDDLFNRAAEL